MKILAFSDLHYPKYKKYLDFSQEYDIIILAGDIIEDANLEGYYKVMEMTEKPIFACFGNTEYDSLIEKLKEIEGIRFLEEEYEIVEYDNKKYAFFGTRGVLDKPTYWQMTHTDAERIYKERLERIDKKLKEARDKADFLVYFSHYSPTYLTLEGERENIYPYLGSRKVENIIKEIKPNLVIHGHAHHGKEFSFLEDIPVFNVALPLNKRPVLIDTEHLPKRGLERWL